MKDTHPIRSALLLASGLLTLALVSKGLLTDPGVRQATELHAQLRALQSELAALHEQNRVLQAEVQSLKTDPEYVDWIIRQELGWVRADEFVLVLQPR